MLVPGMRPVVRPQDGTPFLCQGDVCGVVCALTLQAGREAEYVKIQHRLDAMFV